MGNHSFPVNSSIVYGKRALALLLTVLLPVQLMPVTAWACQACAIAGANAAASGASAASSAAGTSSIANGNSNMSQGQSTQNQAQMAMGAMQIAMGLLGLLAALAAAQQAAKDDQNGSNLSGLNDPAASYPGSTSPTPNPTTSGNISNGSNGSTVDITADKLHSKDVVAGLSAIEKQYGIPGDKFMDALKSGVDPKDLLSNAPKNPVSMDTLNKISDHLAANNTMGNDAAARILASSNAADAAGGPATADNALNSASGAKPASPSSQELLDGDLGLGLNVSPEVKAAMIAKSEEIKRAKEMQAMNSWSIFQLVHSRYQKLETMIYGRVERTNPNPANAVKD